MRLGIPLLAIFVVALGAGSAEAQRSCSMFVVLKSYDAASNTVEVEYERGNQKRYFPKPEGTPADSSKVPKTCRSSIKRHDKLKVTPTGSRLSVTQFRSNFETRMLNDLDDESWVPNQIKKLIEDETEVVALIKEGRERDATPDLTTVYMPITEKELQEIARIEAQAEDVE